MRHSEMEDEVQKKLREIFSFSFKCKRFSVDVFNEVLACVSGLISDDNSLKDMFSKSNEVSIQELTQKGDILNEGLKLDTENVKGFDKFAQKYNINYAVTIDEKIDENTGELSTECELIFQASDPNKLQKAIGEYQQDMEKKEQSKDKSIDSPVKKPKLAKKLEIAQEKATLKNELNAEKVKDKVLTKDKGPEL